MSTGLPFPGTAGRVLPRHAWRAAKKNKIMKNTRNEARASLNPTGFMADHPLLAEFLRDQMPMIVGVFVLAVVLHYGQFGYVPDAERPFAVAGVRVPLWHLVWMGFWTGYLMAIVGEASGIFSLPYSMSILQFTTVSVSPTSLITTFLNPFGALLGYWRGKQWNLDLALWLCIGALLGSPFGPFIRVYLLDDPDPFKAVVGVILFLMSAHLWLQITPWYLRRTERQRAFKEAFDRVTRERVVAGEAPSGLPDGVRIRTLHRSWTRLTIGYWDQTQSFNPPLMVIIGFTVGVVASALGVGGGFMLVPIMVTFFGMPMYVLVAASVPFVILLSVTGLIAYTVTLPLLTGVSASPDWSFGLFVASGAILGAWLGAKTQKFIPETYLKSMLGTITGLVGILYVVNYVWPLPFKV